MFWLTKQNMFSVLGRLKQRIFILESVNLEWPRTPRELSARSKRFVCTYFQQIPKVHIFEKNFFLESVNLEWPRTPRELSARSKRFVCTYFRAMCSLVINFITSYPTCAHGIIVICSQDSYSELSTCFYKTVLNKALSDQCGFHLTGLLKFRAVAEPRNSGISAKSCEIDKNTQNTAKFATNSTKNMSGQHI